MLKDLGTNKPLFVVLFTLYLKEDVDEEGNLKEGVEGGKPLNLMSEKEKEIHEARINGKENVNGHADGAKKEEGKKEVLPDTSEDDLD